MINSECNMYVLFTTVMIIHSLDLFTCTTDYMNNTFCNFVY
jgi:hypothetical protein